MFQVQAPSTWEERQTPNALYFFYPGRDLGPIEHYNVVVVPSNTSSGMGLDAFTHMAKFSIEEDYPEVSLTSSKQARLGTMSGHRFEYKGTRDGKKFYIVQVMALSGLRGYTVQYSGSEGDFNSVRSAFENMVRTFKEVP